MGKKKPDELAARLKESPQATPEQYATAAVVQALQRENRRLTKRLGDREMFARAVADYAPAMNAPRRLIIRAKPAKEPQELVALVSDAHASEQWTKEQTDGLSEYNFERWCENLWYYGTEIVGFVDEDRGRYGLKTLHLDMLGDIGHGALRLDDEVTNEFPSVPSIVNTAWVLWQWLLMLLEHFERIEARCMAGNHGRLHEKPQSKRYVAENRDTLIYAMLKMLAEVADIADRIRIYIPQSRTHTFERLGHRIKIGHGDHIKGGNSIAGIPIYGWSREILRQFRKESIAARKTGIALMECGHWHQSNFLEDILLMNGAMCPADPHIIDELGGFAEPKQWVYYTSRRFALRRQTHLALKHAAGKGHGFSYDRAGMLE